MYGASKVIVLRNNRCTPDEGPVRVETCRSVVF